MKLKGAEILCECLLREGVEVIFGYPGGAVLPLYDALYRYRQLRHILVRHEQGAAHAADGYYRASGRVGVCMATSGPGATNLVTGLMGAKADSVPLVAITGQVPRPMLGKEAFQECDTCAITRPCTKKNFLAMSAREIAPMVYQAFRMAQEGRPGPVLVDIPRDVQQEEADFDYPQVPPAVPRNLPPETLENLPRAARLINQAQRPAIIAGHGVIMSRAWEELRELAERSQVPVINTLLGLSSFPRNHPLSLGMVGMHGMYWANIAVDQADLILGLGMRFDDRMTGRPGSFAPRAKIVQVDVEPSQIGRNVPVEVPLVGDVKEVLKALLPLVEPGDRAPWLRQIRELREEHPSLLVPEGPGLSAQFVLAQLGELIQQEKDVVVVTGVGQHQMWAAQFLPFTRPNSLVSAGGLGPMGYEVPAALGAQVGRPRATVWSVAGDGGFQMTVQELATIVEEGLPVKLALFNNGYLGMVRQWQELFYQRRLKAVPVPGPDYVKLAQAYGIPALRVTQKEQVMPALRRAQRHPGPFLLDLVVEAEENVYPMVPPGASLAETLEDPRLKAQVVSSALP